MGRLRSTSEGLGNATGSCEARNRSTRIRRPTEMLMISDGEGEGEEVSAIVMGSVEETGR